jgi:hypothetical protein
MHLERTSGSRQGGWIERRQLAWEERQEKLEKSYEGGFFEEID